MMRKTVSVVWIIGCLFVMIMLSGYFTASVDAASQATPVKLTFLSWYNQSNYQPLLDAFSKKYPNIKIDFQFAPPVFDYIEKLKVLSVSGQLPDLFYIAAENKGEMLKYHYALDISQLNVVKKLNTTNRLCYTENGKTFAYAPTSWVGGFFYNKDMFKKYGLNPPKTWNELISICKVLQAKNIRPIIERKEWIWNSMLGLMMNEYIAKNPTYNQDVINGKKTFDEGFTPYFVKWYNDMVKPGYVGQDLVGVSPQQFFSEFAGGKAALLAGHAGHLKDIQKLSPSFEIGFFPMPGENKGIKVAYGAVDVGIAIAAKSKHPEQAKQFINFIGSNQGLQLYQGMNGYVIGVKGARSNVDPILKNIAKQYASGEIGVYIPHGDLGPYGSAIQQVLISATQDVMVGRLKADQIAKKMDEKLKELKDAKK